MRNYLRIGDKVLMKDCEVLTIKKLEEKEFISEEKHGYILKRNIDSIL